MALAMLNVERYTQDGLPTRTEWILDAIREKLDHLERAKKAKRSRRAARAAQEPAQESADGPAVQ
jgi:hypothetical protein